MSKRSRRKYHSAPRQVVSEKRDLAREQQVLNAPIEDIASHHPIVLELLSRLPTASSQEALNIGIALQAFIRGDASMMANSNDPSVIRAREQMTQRAIEEDKANEAFAVDAEKFAEEVLHKAETIRPTGDRYDREVAKGMKMYEEARQNAAARRAHKLLRFQERLRTDPKELIVVTGEVETTISNGSPASRILPEVVNVMGQTFVYPPGQHMVPRVIADIIRNKQRSREEIAERRQSLLLDRNRNMNQVNQDRIILDRKYGHKDQAGG